MKLTTIPVTTAITLTEAKAHLNIASGNTSFDTIITDHIEAAQSMLLYECNVLPAVGVVTFYVPNFDNVVLDVYEIDSIVVKYYDTDNALQTLSTGSYKFYANSYPYALEVTSEPGLYDRPDAVQVECTTLAQTDEMIKQVLKMIVADFFENRQNEVAMSTSVLSRATKYQMSLISKRLEV